MAGLSSLQSELPLVRTEPTCSSYSLSLSLIFCRSTSSASSAASVFLAADIDFFVLISCFYARFEQHRAYGGHLEQVETRMGALFAF